jgi:hypothetical protein
MSASDLPGWLHGWSGVGVAYGTVLLPMLAGLTHGRAHLRKWLLSPILAAPVTIAAGASAAMLAPVFSSLGLSSGSLLQVVLTAGATVGLGYASGRALARQRDGAAAFHQRGTLIADPTAADTRPTPRHPTTAPGGIPAEISLAGVRVPWQDETKHFKLIGTTGTGKSTAIKELLDGALQRGDRAVVADPDGGYLDRYFNECRGDVILNPFEPRALKWDLFGEIGSPYDVEQLARSLIPDGSGNDRSWSNYARTFLVAVTRQVHATGVGDVGELYRLLVSADASELKTLVRGTAAQPFLEEHNSRMFDSIRSVTSSAVGTLEYVAQQRSALFSVRQWVARGAATHQSGVLFIPYQAGQIAALRSTISAWMRLAIFAAMDQREGDQRLWFVIDELDALGQIDGLKDALARLRKFGGRCVLGFQSVGQVATTYGSGEAQTIVENCGNTLILRCSSSQHGGTANFASRLIGQREVLRTSISRTKRPTDWLASTTRAEHLGIEPAVMDSEIEQLADRQGFLKLTSMPQWLRVSLPLAPPLPSRLVADPRQRTPPADAASSLLAQVSADAREAWKVQRKAPRSAGAAHVTSVPSPPEVAPVRASRPTRKSPKSSGVEHGR